MNPLLITQIFWYNSCYIQYLPVYYPWLRQHIVRIKSWPKPMLWMILSTRSKVVDAWGWTSAAIGVFEAHGWQILLVVDGGNCKKCLGWK